MSEMKDLSRQGVKMRNIGQPMTNRRPEFNLACALIKARLGAGLTRIQLAKRRKTMQSVVARLEGDTFTPRQNA